MSALPSKIKKLLSIGLAWILFFQGALIALPISALEPEASISAAPKLKKLSLSKKDFQAKEEMEIILGDYQANSLQISVVDRSGEEIPIEIKIKEGVLKIKPPRNFRPGKYTLKISESEQTILERDFSWGVLAINTHKSIYLPNEKVNLAMAVLDEEGKMVCDAKLVLQIQTPQSEVLNLSTEEGTIKVNPECLVHDFTMRPDYEATYQVGEAGVYQLKLTAETKNGSFNVTDSFEVRETVVFDIERESATRIYPPKPYPVTFKIAANQDFEGVIEETVPVDFEIFPPIYGKAYNKISEEDRVRIISWEVSLKKGDKIDLGYYFDAPDVSPQFYLLGPLKFKTLVSTTSEIVPASESAKLEATSSAILEASTSAIFSMPTSPTIETIVFQEARQWQIAVDTPAGPNNPTSGVEDTNSGGTLSWSGYTNVYANDDANYATVSLDKGKVSYYIKATGFNFSLANCNSIDGIYVEVDRHSNDAANMEDYSVRLVNGSGTIVGDNKAIAGDWPTTDAYQTYGGSTDNWTASLACSDVTNTNFGVVFAVKNTVPTKPRIIIASVDHIRVTVYYTMSANTAPTVVLNTADENNFGADTTPTLEFTGTDAEADDVRYNVQIDTVDTFDSSQTAFDSYTIDNQSSGLSIGPGGSGNVAQAFTGVDGDLVTGKFYLKTDGSPTGNATASLYATTGTFGTDMEPTGSALATSDNFDVSTLTASYQLITFTFSTPYTMVAGTKYCISANYGQTVPILVGSDNTSPSHGGNYATNSFGTWTGSSSQDLIFYVYTDSSGPLLDKVSGTDAGFLNTVIHEPIDTDPFNSGEKASYTVQETDALTTGTYYWRTRAIDPNGSSTYGDWSGTRSFTVTVNNSPGSPTSLSQKKTDDTVLNVGDWTNETSVKFTATADDPDSSDTLYLCVEKDILGIGFSNSEDSCGAGVAYSGTPVTVTVTIYSQTDDTEYHWQARVKDEAGEYSSWVSYGGNSDPNDRDYGIDTSAPTGGTVYDGTEAGVDKDFNDGLLSQLSANWSGVDASLSGLDYYEYSIGTSTGGTDVKAWTGNGTSTSVTVPGLTLQTSQVYYFNVRAVDNAGNTQSPVISSDGQQVAPSVTFSVAPTSLSFDNLNSGNNFTNTKTATLTTSTNAYGGYVVRSLTTDLLTSTIYPSETILNFNGGTYLSPDEWLSGDRGFGYHSSDIIVQGVNKFNSTPCSGGGSPPCYAPFSQTGPGDIVVDHTDNVTGSPIDNEQFTMTYKVKTDEVQPASPYVTTVVYTITAQY